MSTSTTLLVILALILLAAVVALAGPLRRKTAYPDPEAQPGGPGSAEVPPPPYAGPRRYEVVLTDWGPDFTGVDGTLNRWRWVVIDADRDARGLVDGQIGSESLPYMLGNTATAPGAALSALQWIEGQASPVRFVYVPEEAL